MSGEARATYRRQIPPLRFATVGMTKGRKAWSGRRGAKPLLGDEAERLSFFDFWGRRGVSKIDPNDVGHTVNPIGIGRG